MTVVALPGRAREPFYPVTPRLRHPAVLAELIRCRTLPIGPGDSHIEVYRAIERLMGACFQTALTGFAENAHERRCSGSFIAEHGVRTAIIVETIRGACDASAFGFESWGYGPRHSWGELCAAGKQYRITIIEEGQAHDGQEGAYP